ncbi:MAG: dehydrogenase [Phycisphaeraceae bacterium]|nr:dehydrogenase [Phycisphaeraceae bacterium]
MPAMSEPITVLGGGNTAFSIAANLALRGHRITLCDLPEFAHMLAPLDGGGAIALNGVAETGDAGMHRVTTDVAEAFGDARLVLVPVPAYAHAAMARACAPHARDDHVIVVMPGTLGALEFARIFREQGAAPAVLAETDTSPYVCRKTGPAEAHIWGSVNMGLGVLPASRGDEVAATMQALFPDMTLLDHVAACGLSSMNPVMHPAGVLMNAGRIERSRGEFYFYDEGVTPGVVRVIEQIDAERRALGRALDVDLCPVADAFHRAGFGPAGDLWSTINGSRMLTQLKAPLVLENRWLTEDTPYGIATWAALGDQLDVPTPTMDAIIALVSIVLDQDVRTSGRSLRDLGIDGLSRAQLDALLA